MNQIIFIIRLLTLIIFKLLNNNLQKIPEFKTLVFFCKVMKNIGFLLSLYTFICNNI